MGCETYRKLCAFLETCGRPAASLNRISLLEPELRRIEGENGGPLTTDELLARTAVSWSPRWSLPSGRDWEKVVAVPERVRFSPRGEDSWTGEEPAMRSLVLSCLSLTRADNHKVSMEAASFDDARGASREVKALLAGLGRLVPETLSRVLRQEAAFLRETSGGGCGAPNRPAFASCLAGEGVDGDTMLDVLKFIAGRPEVRSLPLDLDSPEQEPRLLPYALARTFSVWGGYEARALLERIPELAPSLRDPLFLEEPGDFYGSSMAGYLAGGLLGWFPETPPAAAAKAAGTTAAVMAAGRVLPGFPLPASYDRQVLLSHRDSDGTALLDIVAMRRGVVRDASCWDIPVRTSASKRTASLFEAMVKAVSVLAVLVADATEHPNEPYESWCSDAVLREALEESWVILAADPERQAEMERLIARDAWTPNLLRGVGVILPSPDRVRDGLARTGAFARLEHLRAARGMAVSEDGGIEPGWL